MTSSISQIAPSDSTVQMASAITGSVHNVMSNAEGMETVEGGSNTVPYDGDENVIDSDLMTVIPERTTNVGPRHIVAASNADSNDNANYEAFYSPGSGQMTA